MGEIWIRSADGEDLVKLSTIYDFEIDDEIEKYPGKFVVVGNSEDIVYYFGVYSSKYQAIDAITAFCKWLDNSTSGHVYYFK